ncbi:MAG: hypothetical protein ACPL7D_00215 [Candidatus Sumerlaeaceae bacterium]
MTARSASRQIRPDVLTPCGQIVLCESKMQTRWARECEKEKFFLVYPLLFLLDRTRIFYSSTGNFL